MTTTFIYSLSYPDGGPVFYVGITHLPRRRFYQHMSVKKWAWLNNPQKTQVIRDIKNAGRLPEMTILETTDSFREAARRECWWIEKFGGLDKLTNISPGGSTMTLETRQKISQTLTGRKHSREHRENIARTMRLTRTGKKLSEETKEKISQAKTGVTGTGMHGKKHSEETKKLLSELGKGRKRSLESRLKQSQTRQGKYVGEKNPMFGKKHLEESKEKMSEAKRTQGAMEKLGEGEAVTVDTQKVMETLVVPVDTLSITLTE